MQFGNLILHSLFNLDGYAIGWNYVEEQIKKFVSKDYQRANAYLTAMGLESDCLAKQIEDNRNNYHST